MKIFNFGFSCLHPATALDAPLMHFLRIFWNTLLHTFIHLQYRPLFWRWPQLVAGQASARRTVGVGTDEKHQSLMVIHTLSTARPNLVYSLGTEISTKDTIYSVPMR